MGHPRRVHGLLTPQAQVSLRTPPRPGHLIHRPWATALRERPVPTSRRFRNGDARGTPRASPLTPAATPIDQSGGDGGESNSPSKTLRREPLRACPMICRRPLERASAPCRAVQSRAPRSGLTPDYVTLVRIAASLSDASTTHEAEVASTLTLLPKQRGRESTGGCQVLLFATFFTRPDGNLGSRSPVSGPCRNHTSPQVREDTRTADDTRGRRTRPWLGLRPGPAFLNTQGTRPPHPGRRSATPPFHLGTDWRCPRFRRPILNLGPPFHLGTDPR